jgi:DNA polymerase I-like protein with 3'-5' exonuclease and polymerase domains
MGTPRLIAQIYPRSFPTEADAAKLQKTYLESCPGLAEWQHRVCEIAHRQAFLRNAWGYRHFFWEVFTWNARKQAIVYGNDAKRAVSFLPQSSAAAFMKDTLRLLGASRWRQHLGANCSVHDSVCLMVDEKDVDLAVEELAAVMTRAVPELDGLRIGCEVKVGENWADMSSVKVVIP